MSTPVDTAANAQGARRGRARALLQASGTRLAAERGIDEISVADVLQDAGVSRRTFYSHFANKYELIASVINPALNAGADRLADIDESTPERILPGVVDTYLQLWATHGDALIAIAGLDAGIMPYIANSHRRFGQRLQRLLCLAESAGRLLNDDAALTFRIISRTAVPLLKVHSGVVNGAPLYRRSMLALLAKPHD